MLGIMLTTYSVREKKENKTRIFRIYVQVHIFLLFFLSPCEVFVNTVRTANITERNKFYDCNVENDFVLLYL